MRCLQTAAGFANPSPAQVRALYSMSLCENGRKMVHDPVFAAWGLWHGNLFLKAHIWS